MEYNDEPISGKCSLFDELIGRLEKASSLHEELTNKAYRYTVKIAGVERPSIEKMAEKRPESIIGHMHSIIDIIEKNNTLLFCVTEDLGNAVG